MIFRTVIVAALLVTAPSVASAIDLANRPTDAVALDAARKPAEVIAASAVKPGATVLDVMAGQGYYSELLGRAVGPKGKVIALEPPSYLEDPKAVAGWEALIARQPNVSLMKSLPGEAVMPRGIHTAFFHLTYHDLYWESEKYKYPRTDPAVFNKRLFDAMDKGGSVIVIDHIGVAGMDPRVQAEKTHRIDPATVRADFEKAGFRYVGASEVLRMSGDNPRTLVFDPAVRGKTDRFFYTFRKP